MTLPGTGTMSAKALQSDSTVDWDRLASQVQGRLITAAWPLAECLVDPASDECADFFASAKNPYFLGDDPTLTQSMGWVDAWNSRPSQRILEAANAGDVSAAIRFASSNDIPIAVKGGGHSYKGTSNSADSLLIWTRRMRDIDLHDAFIPAGSGAEPVPAVTIGAGAIWGAVYKQVCAGAGRYVQGGGCLTVGVAGLVQSGGFGSLSKAYGTVAAGLLEAEIVTADGEIRLVNAANDPELFFALRGGGGGTFGVVTSVTLRTHRMPSTVGVVFADITARSDEAFRALIARITAFYAEDLFNPHWGEQISFQPDNVLRISMMSQGLTQQQADATWGKFWHWLRDRSDDYSVADQMVLVVHGRLLWDPDYLKTLPGIAIADDRPGSAQDRIFWASNMEESGQFIHGYGSVWMPSAALDPVARDSLVEGLFEASRRWSVALHTNKGLAGAPEEVRQRVVAETATNPIVTDSFALAICGAHGRPAYPGVAAFEPDVAVARQQASRIRDAIGALKAHVAAVGSYVSESDYFQQDWQQAFWGPNYARLQAAKIRYDPDNVFRGRHSVEPVD
jgi:FAD/FMN-containing dehydrogenase